MVNVFYRNAMEDSQIGHYFLLELGEDMGNEEWVKHIDILVDFWAKIFLDDPLYNSDPYGPHFTIVGLEKEDFTRWVKLFSESTDRVYTQEISYLFKAKAIDYAQEFIERLKMNPESSELFW
ncbi:MAG: group III truncated hemoglobin [Sulfurovum sp.]|nr:group III truncated hemoglobin [Sulfurovum sp.]